MTIDEAIAHAREVAQKQRKDNDNCKYKSEYGCKGCADYYYKPCNECAEEHDQLAEWLEELKAYKEKEFDVLKQDGQLLYKQGVIDGYDKAIDDFVEKAIEEQIQYDCPLDMHDIEKIAEQLRQVERNGNDDVI